MIKKITILLLLGSMHTAYAEDTTQAFSLCTAVSHLEQRLHDTPCAPDLLMTMGEMAQKIEITRKVFQNNPLYKEACHLKIVKSDNFGDFPTYSGYHYQQILDRYPHSPLVDDAAYALIYVITEERYNFSDTRNEKKKLQNFINLYPKSNKVSEARARILEIEEQLKNGQSPILD